MSKSIPRKEAARMVKLSAEDQRAVWDRIENQVDADDDRPPRIVINEQYGGDTNWYLADMALFFGLELPSLTQALLSMDGELALHSDYAI